MTKEELNEKLAKVEKLTEDLKAFSECIDIMDNENLVEALESLRKEVEAL